MSEANEKTEQRAEENLRMAFDLALRKIDTQNSNHSALESKIGLLLAFVGTFSASVIILISERTELLGINIFSLGLAGTYASLIFLVQASHTRIFLDPPNFFTFYFDGCAESENQKIRNQVIADIESCFNSNNNLHSYKAKMYNRAIISFSGSIFLMFLGIIEKM